ncbi:MAG: aspartate-semialdehyde dehydrogenase [Gemmatimonadota bacterium]
MTRPRVAVSILGATGTVGQQFVRLLAGHPWFEIVQVAASAQSVGKPYADAVRWRDAGPIPENVAGLIGLRCDPTLDAPIAFSALDASLAGPLEQGLAAAGVQVVSNASSHRMDPLVPLLIPEVNPDHLGLLAAHRKARGWPGGIVANPNCSTAAIVLGLAPLHRAFGVERLVVATMQAVSGAGYPGVASLDIVGNVVPWIGGEEEKIEQETRKLFGEYAAGVVEEALITVSAHTNRVPVVDGHLAVLSVGFRTRPGVQDAVAAIEAFRPSAAVAALPSTPARPVVFDSRVDRPQPRLDLLAGDGMTVTVGRVRPCPLLDLRLVVLGHNTVRGAAGAAIQNAELLVAAGEVTG